MDTNHILSASLLDILFESRNKEYGAYDLRKSYHKRINIALFIALLFVLLLVLGTVFGKSDGNHSEKPKITSVVIQDIQPEEDKVKPIPPPEVKPPEPVRTEQFTNIVVVPNEEVVEPPPSQDDLVTAKIGLEKVDGIDEGSIVTPTVIDDGKGIVEPKKVVEPEIFIKVEVDAEFPGGMKKWIQFLERNCNGQVASDNGAPAGRHTVIMRFVVDENGQVSDIVPQTRLGYGMEEEAMKVIKKAASMKWTPAIQNGRHVKAYRSQPITFLVEGE